MNWWKLKRKVHPSWLIAWLCFGISAGVYLAKFHLINSSWLMLVVSFVIICIVFTRRYLYLVVFLVIAGVMIGLWRGSLLMIDISRYEVKFNKEITLSGLVIEDADINASNQMSLRLGNITIDGKKFPGQVWVTGQNTKIKRGDKLLVKGIFRKGFGTFVGVINKADIEKILDSNDSAVAVRDWFSEGIRRSISEPGASLGIGFLVGQRRALSFDLTTSLQVVGLTHIIVASGYNLTILVRFARRLFEKVSKYLSALVSVVMIIGFIMITGASPSMTRAGLVTGLCLVAWYYGRRFHSIVLLSIAITTTLLLNPSYAWGDIGWQLSFAAFAGVMIIAPLGQRFFFGKEKTGFVSQILGETISALIATAPIVIAAFGQFSNIAIISNLMLLPLVPLAMLLTFIAGLAGLFLPEIAWLIGLPAEWLISYMINIVKYLADLPWAISNVNLSEWGVWISYVVIFGVVIYMWRVTKYNLRETNLVE